MSLHQSLMEALVVLGRDADEVADRLAALGFKGRRAMADDCPLTHYLRATLGRRDVSVGSFNVAVAAVDFPLPEAVIEFLERFDEDEKYPLLVDDALAHAPECPNLLDHCICEHYGGRHGD